MGALSANPLAAAIQSRLAQLQGGAPPDAAGAPGSSPGGPGGGGSEDSVGSQLAQQSAELHGADPSLILRQLKKIKDAMGVMFIQTFQSLPNVAGHVSKTMATIDRAIKEAENATQTASAVRPPVGLSLAQQSPAGPQGPAPGAPI
jgi:hypothetical protein